MLENLPLVRGSWSLVFEPKVLDHGISSEVLPHVLSLWYCVIMVLVRGIEKGLRL